MKSIDRTILVGVALLGLVAVFWFMVLAPKRQEVSDLKADAAELQTAVEEQEQLAAAGAAAEASFDQNYESLVVLGKAVPSDSDTSSLFVQLNGLAGGAQVNLSSINLSDGAAPAPAPPVATETTNDAAEDEAEESAEVPAPTSPVAATETAAAGLPLGATVGTAGLPVMPYELSVDGSFFELADFLKGVDDLVGLDEGTPAVEGRLLTIDGFTLSPPESDSVAATSGSGSLDAKLLVTSYVTPVDQGTTAGATPAGPAPATTTISSTPPPVAP